MTVEAHAQMDLLHIPASTDALPRLAEYVARLGDRVGSCGGLRRNRLRLAAEEIVVNIARHASPPDRPAWVTVAGGVTEDAVWLRITDSAPPFDPTAPPAAGPPQPWTEGGVGLLLVRSMVDHVCYRRVDGHNETTLLLRMAVR